MPDKEDFEKINEIIDENNNKQIREKRPERKCESFLFDMTGEKMYELYSLRDYKRKSKAIILFLLLIILFLTIISFSPSCYLCFFKKVGKALCDCFSKAEIANYLLTI